MSTPPDDRRRSRAVAISSGLALGALLLAVLAASTSIGYASPNTTAAQAQYAPRSTAAPAIAGNVQLGQTLTASTGTFAGDQPIVFTFQWQRCNPAGASCVAIPAATGQTYTVAAADVGNTLRVEVTGRNASGSSSATSERTAVVTSNQPAGAIKLANGETSVPITSVSPPERLIVDRVSFTPNPIRSRTAPITIRVRVVDTRGNVVRGALVFVRSTPLVTTTPPERATEQNGSVTLRVTPTRDFVLRPNSSVQFFARARKLGDNILTGVSNRRLVQVRLGAPG